MKHEGMAWHAAAAVGVCASPAAFSACMHGPKASLKNKNKTKQKARQLLAAAELTPSRACFLAGVRK
jgi:hypothetical protein